jgi:hypothetical protein
MLCYVRVLCEQRPANDKARAFSTAFAAFFVVDRVFLFFCFVLIQLSQKQQQKIGFERSFNFCLRS